MAKHNQHPAGYYLTVIDTGSLIINATILKFIVLDFHNPPGQAPINYRDTAIEKIGFINTYMLPYDLIAQWVDGNEGGSFRCYSDSTFSLYKPHYLGNCDFIIGINETKNKSTSIQIGPNPTNEIIYLDNDTKGDKLFFSIYSADGKKIKEGTVESKQINCSELLMGIYILTIKSADESSQHFKFVKE